MGGSLLKPGEVSDGAQPPTTAVLPAMPIPGPAGLPSRTGPAPPPRPQGGGRPTCPDCSRLGIGNANHAKEWCFINPASKVYKPEIRARRLTQCKEKGITIPKDILDADPTITNHISGDVADMYAALAHGPALSPAAQEWVVDTVINEQQSVAHLVGNFTHESNGSHP